MMDSVFREMTTQDRVNFMQTMMPRCLSMMFAELDPRGAPGAGRDHAAAHAG